VVLSSVARNQAFVGVGGKGKDKRKRCWLLVIHDFIHINLPNFMEWNFKPQKLHGLKRANIISFRIV
jgi:hypothetical protein